MDFQNPGFLLHWKTTDRGKGLFLSVMPVPKSEGDGKPRQQVRTGPEGAAQQEGGEAEDTGLDTLGTRHSDC